MKNLILILLLFWIFGCSATPVSVTNRTGTKIIDGSFDLGENNGYYTIEINLEDGETSEVWNIASSGLPLYPISIKYTSPIYGKTNTEPFVLTENVKNNIIIYTNNTVDIELEKSP